MSWWSFKPYVSVAQRQAKGQREVEKLRKKGQTITPVRIDGKAIATTFWGKAWCDNLESYSDFENRLPRGRSYVRNGSVCDLQVEPGVVRALVCGSELYRITIKIAPLPSQNWEAVKRQCAGQIGSLVELLQGRLSRAVMEVVTRKDGGLFPAPSEINLDCSCPDWADMCKHVAAALYGIGARLDHQPELLFKLRRVDHLELITEAAGARAIAASPRPARKTIAAGELADVFGLELEARDTTDASSPAPPAPAAAASGAAERKARARPAAASRAAKGKAKRVHGRTGEKAKGNKSASGKSLVRGSKRAARAIR
jgi:uncharacterized Zn finger protein